MNVLQKLTCLTARGGVNYERVPNFEHANRATDCSNRCRLDAALPPMVWKMNSSMVGVKYLLGISFHGSTEKSVPGVVLSKIPNLFFQRKRANKTTTK